MSGYFCDDWRPNVVTATGEATREAISVSHVGGPMNIYAFRVSEPSLNKWYGARRTLVGRAWMRVVCLLKREHVIDRNVPTCLWGTCDRCGKKLDPVDVQAIVRMVAP